jgi:hypothetical protein
VTIPVMFLTISAWGADFQLRSVSIDSGIQFFRQKSNLSQILI